MGLDISVIIKGNMKYEDESCSTNRFLFVLSRGFCRFHQNSNNTEKPIIISLEKALEMELSFLIDVEYDNGVSNENFLAMLVGNEIDESQNKEPSGFQKIDPFLQQLVKLNEQFELKKNYEEKVDYDRQRWVNYFGKAFQDDITSLIKFLIKAKESGVKEFSFDIS